MFPLESNSKALGRAVTELNPVPTLKVVSKVPFVFILAILFTAEPE